MVSQEARRYTHSPSAAKDILSTTSTAVGCPTMIPLEEEHPWEIIPDSVSESADDSTDDGSHSSTPSTFDVLEEANLLFHIALPSVATQFNLYCIFPQAASTVGRLLGVNELAGFSLGSLAGNLTCLSVVVGTLTAADTLMPRAYGSGHYAELGRLAIRGISTCFVLLLPPVLVLSHPSICEGLFVWLGQDPIAASHAAQWIHVFLLGVPANIIFRVIQRFLVAQQHPWPPVFASLGPTFLLHPLMLNYLVPRVGLLGSAWAIVITQWSMFVLLLLYLKLRPVYRAEAWPGLSWSYVCEAFRLEPLSQFLHLSFGGVLSLSEWWFWESSTLIAGFFGVVPLCVHTIAYNLMPLLFMIPLGMSIGLAVRMGTVIAYDARRAKLMAMWTMGFIMVVGFAVATVFHLFRVPIVELFTNDETVLQESELIWGRVSYYTWVLYVFGINGAILRALGMQWRMATIVIIIMWFVMLPTILWLAVVRGGGLVMEWTVLPTFYTVMNLLLFWAYASINWEERSIMIREALAESVLQAKKAYPTETTSLV